MKNIYKKIVVLLLAVCMVFTFQGTAFAGEFAEEYQTDNLNEDNKFEDQYEVNISDMPDQDLENDILSSEEQSVSDEIFPENLNQEETSGQAGEIPKNDELISENIPAGGSTEKNGSRESDKIDILADSTVTGSFPLVEGMDIATVRYYTDSSKTSYAFADFYLNGNAYTYSFESPYSGFNKIEGTQTKTTEPASDATVIAYYFSTVKWDGAVDVSWYDPEAKEFYIENPAQFAGVAAITNGSLDCTVNDYQVKGERIPESEKDSKYIYKYDLRYVVSEFQEKISVAAQGKNDAYVGLEEFDFANKTVYLVNDMDMGGVPGDQIYINLRADEDDFPGIDESYPNWMPIGGLFLADVSDIQTQVKSRFNGVLDGCGHKIENLYCYRWSYSQAKIRQKWKEELGYTDDQITELWKTYDKYGFGAYSYTEGTGLVGILGVPYDNYSAYDNAENNDAEETQITLELDPAIRNLSLSGMTFGRRDHGGIVGFIGGRSGQQRKFTNELCIENCANHAYVYNTDKFGCAGIAGAAWTDSRIINCYNTGNISARIENLTGGIIGYNEHADIICCYNTGDISTNGNKRGREIGSDYAGDNYTISDCYYLHKANYDDPSASPGSPGYYNQNLADSINYTQPVEVSEGQLRDGTLVNWLNVNGKAYVQGADGPVLPFEAGERGQGTVTITQPQEGGKITADIISDTTVNNGTIVKLKCDEETGWNFRYFTLNGERLSADYATVNGDSVISGVVQSAEAGALIIEPNNYCDISVRKNGIIMVDGSSESVEGYPVKDGDPIYEKDELFINISLKDGIIPKDANYEFKAQAGMSNPYRYTFTYTSGETKAGYDNYLKVSDSISGEGTQLVLDVEALLTPKLWTTLADTSWYNDRDTSFTLNTACELAGLDKLIEDGVDDFEGKTILLGNDIDLTNTDGTEGDRCWNGIGSSETDDEGETTYRTFAGTFDGQGHKITSFKSVENGLFDTCKDKSATIKNVSVYGTASGTYAAAIIGLGENITIENCSAYVVIDTADTAKRSDYAGGIIAKEQGGSVISNCFNYGAITAGGTIGGIAGSVSLTGTVEQSVNKGDITLIDMYDSAGGCFGELNGKADQCANYGNVISYASESKNINVGGFAGKTNATTGNQITNCYNAGAVTDKGGSSLIRLGGFVGYASRFVISNSYNYGTVTINEGSTSNNYGSVFGTNGTNSANNTTNFYVLDSACDKVVKGLAYNDSGFDKTKSYYKGIVSSKAADFIDANGVIKNINADKCYLQGNIYPELDFISVKQHVHSGGIATCTYQAVCEECGLSYGELDPDNHEHAEKINVVKPVWNIDGYTGDLVCADCGTLLEKGETDAADTSLKAITVKLYEGETQTTVPAYAKEYSIEEFDSLKSTDTVGYAFGSYEDGKGYSSVMAANAYVTLESVLNSLDETMDNVYRFNIVSDGTSTDTFEKYVLTPEAVNKYKYFYDEKGDKFSAPVAVAIDYGTFQTGSLEEAAKHTVISGGFRLGIGVSEDDFNSKEDLGGYKLITPVKEIQIYLKDINKTIPDIALESKTAAYTGTEILIDAARLPADDTGNITYTYYTDADCTMKTTEENSGAASVGGAPVFAGTYFVLAKVAVTEKYFEAISEPAKLVISKADIKIVKAPSAKKLTYTGKAQDLMNAGYASTGTMQYSLDGKTYSTKIPAAVNAGIYNVYWMIEGDTNHNSTAPEVVKVSIAKKAAAIKVKTTSKTFRLSKIKKKKQTFTIGASVSSKGKLSYKIVKFSNKKAKKYLSINKKTGKITARKGAAKGTCKIKVKINAAATANYKSAAKTVTVKVKVK